MSTNKRPKKAIENNEEIFKQMVLSINAKGVSKEWRYYLNKKITHNRNNLQYLSKLTKATDFKSTVKSNQEKGRTLTSLLDHLVNEIKITDMALNLVIQNLSERENMITAEMLKRKGSAL